MALNGGMEEIEDGYIAIYINSYILLILNQLFVIPIELYNSIRLYNLLSYLLFQESPVSSIHQLRSNST